MTIFPPTHMSGEPKIVASRCQRFWYITGQTIIDRAMPDDYYDDLGVPVLTT